MIEARKGIVNITFGYGKKIMFDHIGYLVSMENHNKICDNANKQSTRNSALVFSNTFVLH
jgi:hypothetical protein